MFKSLLEHDVHALNLLTKKVDNSKPANELSIDDMRAAGWMQNINTPYDVFQGLPSAIQLVLFKTPYYPHFRELYEKWLDVPGAPIKVAAAAKLAHGVDITIQHQVGTDLVDTSFKIALAYVAKAWSLTRDRRYENTTPIHWVENASPDFSTPYPEPHFVFPRTFVDEDARENLHKRQAAIVSLVSLSPTTTKSDVGMERAIRSAILNSLTFDAEEISLQFGEIEFPSTLNCNNNNPSADFFIRLDGSPSVIQPLLVIGQNKRLPAGQTNANDRPEALPDYRARLAAAAHGTMVLIIIHHLIQSHLPCDAATRKYENGTFIEIPKLPKHCFLYGIYYDSGTFNILAHIPVLQDDPKHNTRYWRFCQVPLAQIVLTAKFPTEHKFICLRWRVAVSIATVRKHVETLHEWFLKSREEFNRRYLDQEGALKQLAAVEP